LVLSRAPVRGPNAGVCTAPGPRMISVSGADPPVHRTDEHGGTVA